MNLSGFEILGKAELFRDITKFIEVGGGIYIMRKVSKIISFVSIFILLLLSVLSGCNTEHKSTYDSGTEKTGDKSIADELTDYSIPFKETFEFNYLCAIWAPYSADSTILDYFMEITNTKINIDWVPTDNYQVRVNTALASKDIPDVIYLNPNHVSIDDLIRQDVLIPLDDYFEKYAHNILAQLTSDDYPHLKNLSDGKTYAIPGITDFPPQYSFMLRKDWIDNLELPVPESWEEWINVWRMFRNHDMNNDGNPDNEIPLVGNTAILLGAFGIKPGGNFCVTEDGQYTLVFEHPNYRDYLENMSMLYKEKLIDEEYLTRNVYNAMDMGIAGTAYGSAERARISTEVNRKTDPKATWLCVTPLKGPDGHQNIVARPKVDLRAGITFEAENKNKVESLVSLWNWIYSDEGTVFWNYGVEGVHHDLINGKPILKKPYIEGFAQAREAGLIFQPIPYVWTSDNYIQILTQGKTYEELPEPVKIFYDGLFINEPYFYSAPPVLKTDAYLKYSVDLIEKIGELQANAIIGKISVEQFFSEYEKLKPLGLDEIIEQSQKAWESLK